ncbi:MAG: hypothetical protein ABJL99_19235 [Aliishimia sp.]
MNKFGIALTGIGVAMGGAAVASTLEAPLNTLSEPALSAADDVKTTPLFTEQKEGDVYITASSVGGSVGGGVSASVV